MTTAEPTTVKETEEEEYFRPTLGLQLESYLEADDLSGIHHLARYHWVKQVLKSFEVKSVLDVACGVGYGSYILAEFLPDVQIVGADYDARAIDEASGSHSLPNLTFTRGNIVSWKDSSGEPLGTFDAVVSFDTIEHIAHRDIALLRIAANLTDRGLLALSTPCSHEETRLSPEWKLHKIEYSHHDLKALMRRFFAAVLSTEDGTLPYSLFWREVVNRDRERYPNLSNPLLCFAPLR